jgi:hypothetical protein
MGCFLDPSDDIVCSDGTDSNSIAVLGGITHTIVFYSIRVLAIQEKKMNETGIFSSKHQYS